MQTSNYSPLLTVKSHNLVHGMTVNYFVNNTHLTANSLKQLCAMNAVMFCNIVIHHEGTAIFQIQEKPICVTLLQLGYMFNE
jgi:hypothetical protein